MYEKKETNLPYFVKSSALKFARCVREDHLQDESPLVVESGFCTLFAEIVPVSLLLDLLVAVDAGTCLVETVVSVKPDDRGPVPDMKGLVME